MALALRPEQQMVIQATLDFGNLREIESTQQVEDLFRRLPLPKRWWRTLPKDEVQAFANDQREVCGWLKQIAETGSVKTEKLIAKRVRTIELVNVGLGFADSRLELNYELSFSGVQACYTYAIALLLDYQADNVGDRLSQCEYHKCNKFFLDTREGSGRRKTKYCRQRHANADRQRRWRNGA